MNRLFKISLMLTISMVAFSSVHAQDEINRWEFFGGYSYMNLNRGFDPDEFDNSFSDFPSNRVNAHGFNGSITYNFCRFIGAKFDLTLHSHGEDFNSNFITVNPPLVTPGTFKTSQNVYQFMGGIQIKDNKKEGPKLKPWAHILAGISDQHFGLDRTAPTSAQLFKVNSTDFAMKFGGGLDLAVHKHVDIRLIGADWNPIFRGDLDLGPPLGTAGSVLQNNFLLNFGVVLH
jgi:hypothetical protein